MQTVLKKPNFLNVTRSHAKSGMTMLEVLIGSVLMALVAYIASTLFLNIEGANRSANAKSTAHESFRILTMRFDNQIQNRMPLELAMEEFSSLTNPAAYEPAYKNKIFRYSDTRLKSHSIVVGQAPPYSRRYDRFVMTVECSAFNGWNADFNTFIRNNSPCGASLPNCGSNSRPVIRFSQRPGLTAAQVNASSSTIQHSANTREFPTPTMPLYQTAAAATFCVNEGPNEDLNITYFFYYFRAGKVLSWLETVSHLGKEVNHGAGAFPKADR